MIFSKPRIGLVCDSNLFQYQNFAREKELLDSVYTQHQQVVDRVYNYLTLRGLNVDKIDIADSSNFGKFLKKSRKVMIVPDLSCVSEDCIIQFERYLEKGGIIFTAYPSFWFDQVEFREEQFVEPSDVSKRRFRNLFSMSLLYEKQIKGKFTRSSYASPELIECLPLEFNYEGEAVLVVNPIRGSAGELQVRNYLEINQSRQIAPIEDGRRSFPAFLVSQYPSGGFLVYSCIRYFEIFEKDGLQPLLDNIVKIPKLIKIKSASQSSAEKPDERLNRIERTLRWNSAALLGIIVFLFLYFIPSQWFSGNPWTSLGLALIVAIAKEVIVKYSVRVWKKIVP